MGFYLPEAREIPKLPKQWIANVCATVLKDTFTNWVKARIKERNDKIMVKKGLAIDLDPEIAAAFHASTKTSSKLTTTSYFLTITFVRSSPRRRGC